MTKQFRYFHLRQRLHFLTGIFFIFIFTIFLCTPFSAISQNSNKLNSDTISTQEKQKGKQKGKQKNSDSNQTAVSENTSVNASSSANGNSSSSSKGTSSSSSKGQKKSGGNTSESVSTASNGSHGKQGGHEGQGSSHSSLDVSTTEDDTDSDRPPWAGKNGDRSQKPGGGNHGAETSKGDNYGDLYVMSRYDDGTLIYYTAEGEVCEDSDGCYPATILSTGELFILVDDVDPPEENVVEVEFGRLNIARAPDKVLEHALDEALSKLDGAEITLEDLSLLTDDSGRLLTYDELGELTATAIDSPLENLALYQAILEQYDSTSDADTITIHSGSYSITIEVAALPQLLASTLAAAADKTETIEIDEVVYLSVFLEVEEQLADLVEAYEDWYSPETFYAGTVTVLDQSDPDDLNWVTDELLSFVTLTEIPTIDDDSNGIDVFTQAVDDSLQILEFLHDTVVYPTTL